MKAATLISAEDLLNKVRKFSVAFVVDSDLSIRRIKAAKVDGLGQAGYAMSRDMSESIYWARVGESYFVQPVDLKPYENLYLHHELAQKGTRLKDGLGIWEKDS
ncbi:MAG: hypothetical protein NZ931_06000 [Aigarchaeota archaeon]|nr:hypothetical protein [Aigarchaeota archaeon]